MAYEFHFSWPCDGETSDALSRYKSYRNRILSGDGQVASKNERAELHIAHIALAIMLSLLAVISGIAKLRRDAKVVKVINEIVGVPMKWFPWLAACEFAGALGLLIGIAWPPLGLAAAIGLSLYFLGAVIAHVRVGDVKGIATPAIPLGLAVACLVTRLLSTPPG